MPRKRFAGGQRKLTNPEVVALTEFKEELGGPLFNEEVVCPFCAFKARVIQFRTKKSEKSASYSTKMFECPDCRQNMRRATLLRDMTVSEWARWLYFDIIMYHGYDRISFPKLLQRLKEYGWANEFWSAWKAAKEGRQHSDIEDYAEYMKSSEDSWLTKETRAKETKRECDNWKNNVAGIRSMFCTPCDKYDTCWGYLIENDTGH